MNGPIPGYFTNVDRVEILANAGVSAAIQSVGYVSPSEFVSFGADPTNFGVVLSGKASNGSATALTYTAGVTASGVGVGADGLTSAGDGDLRNPKSAIRSLHRFGK